MEGWIKLYRKSRDNFLYKTSKPHSKREAWEDMLMLVNIEDKKVLLGNETIECKRGQSLMSLDHWAKLFNWNKSAVKRFFDLLQNENMLCVENLHKTTRITICNYELYQGERNADETHLKRERNADETHLKPTKEGKEVKEFKKDKKVIKPIFNFKQSLIDLGIEENVVSDWLIVRKNKKASNTETAFKTIKKQIEISSYTPNECIETAVKKSWAGFESKWMDNLIRTTNEKTFGINRGNEGHESGNLNPRNNVQNIASTIQYK